jgi:hypothetical protein
MAAAVHSSPALLGEIPGPVVRPARAWVWIALVVVVALVAGGVAGIWYTRTFTPYQFVPGTPTRLVVTRYTCISTRPMSTWTVRNRRTIAGLTSQLNRLLPVPQNSVYSCPPASPSDVLRFVYPNGDRWTVTVGTGGCEFVTGQGNAATASPALLRLLQRI